MERVMQLQMLPGRRFGLTADTHDVLVDWPAVSAALATAWGPIDAILHCGDLTSPAALTTLAEQAPVFATRNAGDPPAQPPLLTDGPRLFVADGVRIGMIFTIGEGGPSEATCADIFGEPIDVCVYGGTHEANVAQVGGVLFVGPGSPSLAKRHTAAVLTVEHGRAAATIVDV
jgi:putative phosphoesterase